MGGTGKQGEPPGKGDKSNKSPPSKVPPRTRYFLSKLSIAMVVLSIAKLSLGRIHTESPSAADGVDAFAVTRPARCRRQTSTAWPRPAASTCAAQPPRAPRGRPAN